jgi:hypothetical protein
LNLGDLVVNHFGVFGEIFGFIQNTGERRFETFPLCLQSGAPLAKSGCGLRSRAARRTVIGCPS